MTEIQQTMHIIVNLSDADRARLDKILEALERKACDKCVATAMAYATTATSPETKPAEPTAKEEANAEAPKTAVEGHEASTPTTTPQEEEKPTEATETEPTTEKQITHDELMAKVIELSAKDLKLKAQAKDIVLSYAPRVKAVPEDKLNECYKKLVALGG